MPVTIQSTLYVLCIPLILTTTLLCRYYDYPHFTDEAQKDEITYLGNNITRKWKSWDSNPGYVTSEFGFLLMQEVKLWVALEINPFHCYLYYWSKYIIFIKFESMDLIHFSASVGMFNILHLLNPSKLSLLTSPLKPQHALTSPLFLLPLHTSLFFPLIPKLLWT